MHIEVKLHRSLSWIPESEVQLLSSEVKSSVWEFEKNASPKKPVQTLQKNRQTTNVEKLEIKLRLQEKILSNVGSRVTLCNMFT